MADALGDAISSKGTIENRKSRLEEADSANQKVAESVLRSAFDSFRKEHAVDSDDREIGVR